MVFTQNFLWGAASAAYQIEGAINDDGKTLGIWDALSEGHVAHNENGHVACDHYHLWKQDVAIMKSLGLKAYRFSISWTRVMPEPGVINNRGLQFYSDLVDALLDAGITPMVTLYHWNLPMWAHEYGGWHSERIVDDFAKYTASVVDALSDRVQYWMTINEPASFIGNGYITGLHAPFEKRLDGDQQEMMRVLLKLTRHVLLAHGVAARTIREHALTPSRIGAALNGDIVCPVDGQLDIEEAREQTFVAQPFFNAVHWWADPMILGTCPQPLSAVIDEDDLAIIHQPLDFFGFNCYHNANYQEWTGSNPYVYPGMPRTAMNWPVTPDALYWAARFITERYHLPIMFTENGMANIDIPDVHHEVHDPQRIDFMYRYLQGVEQALSEGIDVIGYLYWSILDNFEWAEGYDKRFGLVYVDYQTQERILKDSAHWYAKVIERNQLL